MGNMKLSPAVSINFFSVILPNTASCTEHTVLLQPPLSIFRTDPNAYLMQLKGLCLEVNTIKMGIDQKPFLEPGVKEMEGTLSEGAAVPFQHVVCSS